MSSGCVACTVRVVCIILIVNFVCRKTETMLHIYCSGSYFRYDFSVNYLNMRDACVIFLWTPADETIVVRVLFWCRCVCESCANVAYVLLLQTLVAGTIAVRV
jgi:hypothetical protein